MVDIKKVYEDAVVGAAGGTMPADVQAAPNGAMSDVDILGHCDHNKECSYMKDGCFHLPVGSEKAKDREIFAGKKKKKQKNDYLKGMNVIEEADLDRKSILAIHNIPERKILAFIKDNYDEAAGAAYVQSIAYNPASKTYFIKFDDANDNKFKYVSAEFDGKNFLTSDDLNVYDSAGMKEQFEKILRINGNSKDNIGSDNWSLWTVWGKA